MSAEIIQFPRRPEASTQPEKTHTATVRTLGNRSVQFLGMELAAEPSPEQLIEIDTAFCDAFDEIIGMSSIDEDSLIQLRADFVHNYQERTPQYATKRAMKALLPFIVSHDEFEQAIDDHDINAYFDVHFGESYDLLTAYYDQRGFSTDALVQLLLDFSEQSKTEGLRVAGEKVSEAICELLEFTKQARH